MKYVLEEKTLIFSSAISGELEASRVGSMGADSYSCVAEIDVDTPAAKTFDSGVAASLVVQDLTYTADVRGTAGNSISIAYTAGAVAGAEVVTVVGTSISVQISTGVSTATQVKTAVDASVAASALISVAVTGTGSNAQVTAAVTPLAGGIASEVDVTENSVSIPTHGYTVGLKGQLTSTGTLPAGLSLSTDYFVIVVDANTIKFATTLLLAQAGTPVDITGQGSSAAVNTFTPTAIAGGTFKLQQSEDNEIWVDLGSATNVTVDANLGLEKDRPTMKYVRPYITLTAGHISATVKVVCKGDKE